MKPRRIQFLAVLCFATTIGVANASWYDDYEDGIKAVRAGDWARVISRMTSAINGNAKEGNNVRTYGAIFINYKPYYYRGLAYLNTGKYQQAITDFEKTMGPGQENRGSIEELIKRAKDALAVPDPTPPPPQPPPPQPPTDLIDPVLRAQADSGMKQAQDRLEAAQQRGATGTNEYKEAMQQYRNANSRLTSATSNADLRAVINVAREVVLLANSANIIVPPPPPPPGPEEPILGPIRANLRGALESYFEGDFVAAERKFKALANKDLPKNPWIWAFLGASQWSRYAFETEDYLKRDAINSFKKARQYGWKGGLPQKYFSRRIRNAFANTAG